MSSEVTIALVAAAAGLSCLVGVFLVLRRMAMMADAISHSILPGLVAGYVLAKGPNLLTGFVGAALAGLLTVISVEALTKSRRVHQDAAIGLVFPAFFAIGVLVISKFYSNLHIDTDAVLFGEIAFAPFDTWTWQGRDMGAVSLWILTGLAIINAAALAIFYKELKLTTFDPGLAACLGFMPALVHYGLMTLVAVTTVGAFSAVGAILSVALIIVPPMTASLMTKRLPAMIGASVAIGVGCALLGNWLAVRLNVSISGMIATTLGVAFGVTLLASPRTGLISQWLRRRAQQAQFASEMLIVHLATHADTPRRYEESTMMHLEQELGWQADTASRIVKRAVQQKLVTYGDGVINLTHSGRELAERVGDR